MKRILALIVVAAFVGAMPGCTVLEKLASNPLPGQEEGPVEALAANNQMKVAEKVLAKADKLSHYIEIDRGLDKDGNPLPPIKIRIVDSRLYDVLIALADFTGYKSPPGAWSFLIKFVESAASIARVIAPWRGAVEIIKAQKSVANYYTITGNKGGVNTGRDFGGTAAVTETTTTNTDSGNDNSRQGAEE